MAVLTYKCSNCDGPLKYNPEKQNFTCEFCGSTFTETEIEAKGEEDVKTEPQPSTNEDASKSDEQADNQDTAVLYTCPSCGAEIVTDSTTAATFCFYCHNPVVLTGRLDGKFKPEKIIPFAYDKEQAESRFFDWIETKKFVPSGFFSEEQIEKMVGVYFPYWAVDCELNGSLSADGDKLKIWRVGEIEYTETSHYKINRGGTLRFMNMMKLSLQKADKKLVEGIQPFEMADSKPFNMSYLSGFQAEKRDMEREAFSAEISSEVNEYASSILRDTVSGYENLSAVNDNIDVKSTSFTYALVPVWVMTYNGEGNTYYYAMNGQTGKIFGVLPIDKNKLFATVLAIGAVVLGLGTVLGWLL